MKNNMHYIQKGVLIVQRARLAFFHRGGGGGGGEGGFSSHTLTLGRRFQFSNLNVALLNVSLLKVQRMI